MQLGTLGRTGDATALFLPPDSLRPPAGKALANGVGVALQRERLSRANAQRLVGTRRITHSSYPAGLAAHFPSGHRPRLRSAGGGWPLPRNSCQLGPEAPQHVSHLAVPLPNPIPPSRKGE